MAPMRLLLVALMMFVLVVAHVVHASDEDFIHRATVQESNEDFSNRDHIKVASFNIQVFGPTKMSYPEVRARIVDILKRFEVIFIQEIRDSSETAIFDLLDDLNDASPRKYKLTVSSRHGRSASKEQYAYLYTDDVSLLNVAEYPDPNNWFERPPYAMRMRTKFGQIITMIGCHVSPKTAVQEIDNLTDVYHYFKNPLIGYTGHFIIMGDLNAGCSYVRKSHWPNIRLRTDTQTFKWLIDDDQITTTIGGGGCPYDRFVVGDAVAQWTDNRASVFNFTRELNLNVEDSRRVSDHYPIVMNIYRP